MNLSYLGFVLCGFAAVVLLGFGAYMVWDAVKGPRRQTLTRRLQSVSGEEAVVEEVQLIKDAARCRRSTTERWLLQLPGMPSYDLFLLQTGLKITASETIIRGLLGLAAVLLAGSAFDVNTKFMPAVVLGTLLAGVMYLHHKKNKRARQIEAQLPAALDLIARSMQAGHTFSSALHIAAGESKPPISDELHTLFDELTFGVSIQDSMRSLAQRVPNEDVHFFVVAVLIQSETGGKLADILKHTASLIRERQKIAGVVRVLSAEGTISAVILSTLPFAVAGLLALINPEFIATLWTDPMGIRIALAALSLMGIGIFWMWRLVKIKV